MSKTRGGRKRTNASIQKHYRPPSDRVGSPLITMENDDIKLEINTENTEQESQDISLTPSIEPVEELSESDKVLLEELQNMEEDDFIKEYEVVIQFYQVTDHQKPEWYMLSMDKKFMKIISYRKYLEKKRDSDARLLEYIMNRPILLSDDEKNKLYKLSIDEREKLFKVEEAYKRRAMLAKQSEALQQFFSKKDEKTTTPSTPQDAPIPRDYSGYTVNFNSIFTNSAVQKGFLEHLKSEMNSEGFEFCILCDLLPNDNDPETVRHFMEICDLYIVPGSKKELNISGSIRERILDAKKKIKIYTWTNTVTPKEMLASARHAVSNDQKDPFARFISSDRGYEIVTSSQSVKDPNVIVKNKFDNLLNKLTTSGTKQNINNLCLSLADVDYHLKFLEHPQSSHLSISIAFLEHPMKHEPSRSTSKLPIGKQTMKGGIPKKPLAPYVFSTALLIDDVMLEWDEFGLCNPRIVEPNEPFIKFPVMKMDHHKYFSFVAQMASMLTTWNISYKSTTTQLVDVMSPRLIQGGNCQDFVNALLELFGHKISPTSYLMNELLDRVKKRGSTEICFNPSMEFTKKYKLKEINNHAELDEFLDQCMEIEEQFEKVCRDEYVFLSVIDEYYWKKFLIFERSDVDRRKDPLLALSRPTFKCPFRRDHISYKHEKKAMNVESVTDIITMEQLDI